MSGTADVYQTVWIGSSRAREGGMAVGKVVGAGVVGELGVGTRERQGH